MGYFAKLYYGWKIPQSKAKQAWLKKNYMTDSGWSDELPERLEISEMGEYGVHFPAAVFGIKLMDNKSKYICEKDHSELDFEVYSFQSLFS